MSDATNTAANTTNFGTLFNQPLASVCPTCHHCPTCGRTLQVFPTYWTSGVTTAGSSSSLPLPPNPTV